MLIAILGAVIVVFASNPEEDYLDPRRILQAISRLSFKVYVAVTFFSIVVLAMASGRYGERWIWIDIALVALFGGYTALSTKALSSLLTYTLYRVFTFPITYGLIAVLSFTAVMQVKYLSRALQHYDSTQVIPTHFVFFTLSVIIGSAILYQDFEGATSWQLAKFFFGCALTFVGVWLITSNRPSLQDDTRNLDEEQSQEELFSTVASVNLERSAGARTPTSFYDDDDDAQEINDANVVVNRRTRVDDLVEGDDNAASPGPHLAAPVAMRPAGVTTTAIGDENTPLLRTQPPPLSRFASSPGTTSRSYVPGTGMGLIVDSYVRERMLNWQTRERKRILRSASGNVVTSLRARATPAESLAIDSRTAPLHRAQTRDQTEHQ